MAANYLAAKTATVSYNGTTYTARDCSLSWEVGEVDVTNLNSGGFYEDITDIRKFEMSGTLVLDSNALASLPTDGSLNAASVAIPNWKTLAGNARLLKQGVKVGPRGAVEVSFNMTGSGSFTFA
jgi:hypothetical protein